MLNNIYSFLGALYTQVRREAGQTMAEYGILIAVIALVVILAAVFLGNSLSGLFSTTGSKV